MKQDTLRLLRAQAKHVTVHARIGLEAVTGVGDVPGLTAALAGKAASSHTHIATAISDSTAAGRTVLTAADASAQRTALGLGAAALAATLDAVPAPVAAVSFNAQQATSFLIENRTDDTGCTQVGRIWLRTDL